MMAQDANRVIVAGCGPVGAVMALALVKKGISVTLIEQLPDAAEDQRAATIHPPTVEMLVGLGLVSEMFSELPSGGMPAPLFHFRDRVTGELVAEFDISLLKGEVPYPYVVQWEQYKLVHAALPHINASGIGEVRFSTKLVGLAQTSDGVEAAVITAGGGTEKLRGKYLIGADGGSSTVRRLAEIAFVGFTWPERFIKIGTSFDFGATGRGYCTRNYFSDPDEWINLFKVKGRGPPGIWRGVFPVPETETDEEALSVARLQRRLQGIHEKGGDYDIPYYALYPVHQRVAATFKQGSRAARRRLRPCEQSDRRHGHERRHPRRHQSFRKTRRGLVRPCRGEPARSLHAAAPQGAGRLRSSADHPEQKIARRKRPGDSPPAFRRIKTHVRGHHAAQEIPLSLVTDRQFEFGECD
jgi:3-(3-hydroxy-phenyl)propionate hydroxylase